MRIVSCVTLTRQASQLIEQRGGERIDRAHNRERERRVKIEEAWLFAPSYDLNI